jgi:hypothetical protein
LKLLLQIEKNKNESPGGGQILAELTQAGGELLHSKIHKLINSIWNFEKLPHQWKEAIIVPTHKKGDKSDCSNYRGILLLSDCLCDLGSEFLAVDPDVPGSIPGATRFSEKWVWNGVYSAS